MRCPFCGGVDSKVVDSRLSQGDEVTRRRRECESCAQRFTTYERVELVLPMVVKKDGSREAFERDKLLAGLRRACEKRPVASEQLDRVVDHVERRLSEAPEREVASRTIGEQVMEQLRDLDKVAFVRFASVYRSFQDVEEFRAELDRLLSRKQT